MTPPFAADPPDLTDRDFWGRVASDPRHASWREATVRLADETPPRPELPTASEYLAARRHNDRAVVDRHWKDVRPRLYALALRRCLLGSDDADPDDRLMDWLWGLATMPTWAVSAHLDGQELPRLGHPVPDLAACQFAAGLAECLRLLGPWMRAQSRWLFDDLVHLIDRRTLVPLL